MGEGAQYTENHSRVCDKKIRKSFRLYVARLELEDARFNHHNKELEEITAQYAYDLQEIAKNIHQLSEMSSVLRQQHKVLDEKVNLTKQEREILAKEKDYRYIKLDHELQNLTAEDFERGI